MRLLLIEDNQLLAQYVGKALRANGFAVDSVETGADGDAAITSTNYDAVILDLGLPDIDGLSWLGSLRARLDQTPVLIITARAATPDLVQGLNTGADDYLRKPFELEELIARTRALLRRPGQAAGLTMSQGNVSYDPNTREVLIDGAPTDLSRRECSVLELMMRRSGRVVSKAAIEEAVYSFGEETASNAIEVLIHRLRRRLRDANANVFVHTLRGLGYVLSNAPPADRR